MKLSEYLDSAARGEYIPPYCRTNALVRKQALCVSNLAETNPATEEDYDFDWE
ncbi:MAG: hypothetical protein IJS62_09135 [Bacteroidales bacterium]|nr:hypothetical protein [Bacteroidales bacterium]